MIRADYTAKEADQLLKNAGVVRWSLDTEFEGIIQSRQECLKRFKTLV
jgi:hypothetical protein